jgi:hypothetical protein
MAGMLPLVPFASFALPAVAIAVAGVAVAAPVLVHLLSRQRFRVVEWAAMRFLAAAQKRHRKRIDHWLLMLLRVAVLVLMLAGLCAATPWAERLWQTISPGPPEFATNAVRTHHVFVIDATLSATTRKGERTRFESAVAMATDALNATNPGDGVSVVVLTGTAQVLVAGPANDPEKVIRELNAVRPTHAGGDVAGGLAAVAEIVAKSPRNYPRRQVTVFTDLQRSAWAVALPNADRPAPDVWPRILARADVAVVDVAGADVENLAVTDVALADPLPLVESPASLTVSVQNFGKADRRGVRLELLVGRPSAAGPDAHLLPVEQKAIEAIPPGERASITFSLDGPSRFREAGLHILQVKLVEGDDLPADDVRSLAVDVRSGLSCVIVNGKPSSEPLRRASGYLSESLAPGGRALPGNPARPRVVSVSEFADASLTDLSAVDCVFLCDVPTLTPSQVTRLEGVLARGGGVVFGLGPNAAANADHYNRTLYDDGKGMLPGKLGLVIAGGSAGDAGFRLAGGDESFRRPPLDAFRDDNARGGLTAVPFRKYVKLIEPAEGRGRRMLSFVPATPRPGDTSEPDAAIVEKSRHRGRVVLVTSTFNSDWTDWPVLPSYLPFAHELLRHAATAADRRTVAVGEAIEEFPPAAAAGLTAAVTGPEGIAAGVPVAATDDGLAVRFLDTTVGGLYRIAVAGKRDAVFAVNPAERSAGGGSESDLRRADSAELRAVSPAIQIVESPDQIRIQSDDGSGSVVVSPRPHGPSIARWVLVLALVAILVELTYAWRVGPGRTALAGAAGADPDGSDRRLGRTLVALFPLALVGFVLFTVFHHAATGQFLGFLPHRARVSLEGVLGVPSAGPGEGTRWRLESFPTFLRSPLADKRVLGAVAATCVVAVLALYRLERRGVAGWRGLIVPASLRIGAVAFAAFVLLPQVRLAFDREGWPDVAIVFDTSRSMATIDGHKDGAVRTAAEQLAKGGDLSAADRLALAKAVVGGSGGWVERLLNERQVKVHLYAVDEDTRPVVSLDETAVASAATEATDKLTPSGPASRLGDGVKAVLKAFRGGSLAAVVVLTDGQVTAGESLVAAGREAARSGVPVYFVGLGDPVSVPDLGLSDLRADDVVMKNDQIVFEVRLSATGPPPPATVPVVLSELRNGKPVEVARATARPDPSGKPVPVRLTHTPTEAGEKTFVLETPGIPGELETANNRIERVVTVTETKTLRVLLIEGTPRYEYRFVKDLLERESDAVKGNKSIELGTIQLSAAKEFALQDRSALRSMPTRDELFTYDAVILGDADPKLFPRPEQTLQDLADFVTVKGGGLIAVAGELAMPHKYYDTPLGDVLPVLAAGTPRATSEDAPLTEGYKPRLTPIGLSHPLFRFAAEDADNAQVWAGLKPFLWGAGGYKRKLSAEVLATHPDRPAADNVSENHPLVLQQFAGAGRVMFFGFDETWRWRWRDDEPRFTQFWVQAVRVMGRNRVRRVELRTDRQTPYRQGEPIKLTVRFPDDAAPPAATVAVRVTAERSPLAGTEGETETQTVQFAKVENTRATYEGTLVRTPPGEYRFRLTSPDRAGPPSRAEARVLPPPGERERLDLNVVELTKAATEARGRYFTLAEAGRVPDELPEAERVPLNSPCPPIPLWNHAGSFAIVFLLFVAEWWYRRRERLV